MWEQNVSSLIIASLIGGAVCGALWDLFRIQRIFLGIPEYSNKTEKSSSVSAFLFVLFQDVTFFAVAACILAVVFYYGNNGNFQIYALICVAAGAVLYAKTVGAVTARLAACIKDAVCRMFKRARLALKRAAAKIISVLRKIKLRKTEKKSKEAV